MRFYDVSVNRSVPTEANRGLTSYTAMAIKYEETPVSSCLAFTLVYLSKTCPIRNRIALSFVYSDGVELT
jgi:hypothetical protein